MRKSSALLLIAFAAALTANNARATTLTVTDGQCGGSGGAGQCTATNGTVIANAYLPTEITPGSGTAWTNFQGAFNSWNASVGNTWTLVTGTLSGEAIFNVDIYRAYVGIGSCAGDPFCGGAEIQISYKNGGSAPNPINSNTNPITIQSGDAVWSQSIVTNQKLAGSLPGNPYLDNPTGIPNPNLGPPAYPFQYNGSLFYDMPARDAQANWLADAWISTADYSKDVLTVYDGVEWGFSVATPLPAALPLFATGLGALGLLGWRRKRKERLS